MATVYGYHRTSTTEQHLDRGITEIKGYCQRNNIHCKHIFTDQQTGKDFHRPQYTTMKAMCEKGDTIIITEIDRLGRNKESTLKELRGFKDNGVRVMILEIPSTLYDKVGDNSAMAMFSEALTNMLIEVYAINAQVEIEKRSKRQREGIEAMKARGEWTDYGRPRCLSLVDFGKAYERVLKHEIKPFDLMRELRLNQATYYRYKKEYENQLNNQIWMVNNAMCNIIPNPVAPKINGIDASFETLSLKPVNAFQTPIFPQTVDTTFDYTATEKALIMPNQSHNEQPPMKTSQETQAAAF